MKTVKAIFTNEGDVTFKSMVVFQVGTLVASGIIANVVGRGLVDWLF